MAIVGKDRMMPKSCYDVYGSNCYGTVANDLMSDHKPWRQKTCLSRHYGMDRGIWFYALHFLPGVTAKRMRRP